MQPGWCPGSDGNASATGAEHHSKRRCIEAGDEGDRQSWLALGMPRDANRSTHSPLQGGSFQVHPPPCLGPSLCCRSSRGGGEQPDPPGNIRAFRETRSQARPGEGGSLPVETPRERRSLLWPWRCSPLRAPERRGVYAHLARRSRFSQAVSPERDPWLGCFEGDGQGGRIATQPAGQGRLQTGAQVPLTGGSAGNGSGAPCRVRVRTGY